VDRRAFIAGAAALFAAPLAAGAQQPGKAWRIGFLSTGSPTSFATRLAAFRGGLRDLGYAEDSVFIEQRWAEGREGLLSGLAAELVHVRVAILVAVGTPASMAAKRATDTIPIVMVAVGDPVGTGLVASLARPGGNITGLSNLAAELTGKLLDLLREIVPGFARVAILSNPGNPVHAVYRQEAQVAAERVGVRLQSVEARKPEDFDLAFAAMVRQQAGGLIVLPDPLNLSARARIAELAARTRLPAIYPTRDYADAGGLVSYGPYTPDLYRRAAVYVDRILKGAKPGDLPIEQPTKFELVTTLKTAKALGLTIPPSILLRAEQVIE
jgi:putative tryptophan/tyrosine transport system substrate-binding protein